MINKEDIKLSDIRKYVESLSEMLERLENGESLSRLCKYYDISLSSMHTFFRRCPNFSNVYGEMKMLSRSELCKIVCTPAENLWLDVTDKNDILYAPGDLDNTMDFIMKSVLTEEENIVLHKKYWDCMPYSKIAEEIGISSHILDNIIRRAKNKLRVSSYRRYLDMGLSLTEMQRLSKLTNIRESLDEEIKRLESEILERKDYLGKINEFFDNVEIDENALGKNINYMYFDISVLDLTTRSFNALKKGNYNVIKDIAQSSLKELSRLRNMGKGSLSEVQKKMKDKFNIDIPKE